MDLYGQYDKCFPQKITVTFAEALMLALFYWIDYLGILVFILGCVFNTSGELQRDIWKRKPENTGKIYTQGFFKYSMHVNYFGDLLWVTGYAIITQNWYSILIPAFLFGFFAFYNIPMLDKYLHDKYDGDFEEYAKMTKRLIPFVC